MKKLSLVVAILGMVITAAASPPADDALAAEERAARIDATAALARLEVVLARQALHAGEYEDAARKALRVLELLDQLPPEMDMSVYELQAEGILAKAARQGVKVEELRRDAAADVAAELPPLTVDPKLDAKTRAAACIARGYTGPSSPDIDTRGDARILRERTERNQTPGEYGYLPAREIVDTEGLRVREEQRAAYQDALEGAYRDSEARALVEAHEARVIPPGWINYPDDWPEIIAKRKAYESGMVARSPSWWDEEGRESYTAVYDIHDLIREPAFFPMPVVHPFWAAQSLADRNALRQYSDIFSGTPEDLAAGIPLLSYFGGVYTTDMRPHYSRAEQARIITMIRALTEKPTGEARVEPLEP